jgi:hypothetical protein
LISTVRVACQVHHTNTSLELDRPRSWLGRFAPS